MRNTFLTGMVVAMIPIMVAFLGTLMSLNSDVSQLEMSDSTVLAHIPGGGHGSAVHIGDGYYLTAAHVVSRSDVLNFEDDKGNTYEGATVLWKNEDFDVALVYADMEGVAASNLECRKPFIGEDVVLKGNPMNMKHVSSYGKVAGNPLTTGPWGAVSVIDAAIGPGMSGGGLFDEDGDLIGINVGVPLFPIGLGAATMGFGYSVPGNILCHLLGRDE